MKDTMINITDIASYPKPNNLDLYRRKLIPNSKI